MNKTKLSKDNKGFSLVELIIVIAIMAILVGIIALQVIPYMEKSRVGKDQQTIDSVYNAFNNSLADESVSGDIEITISDSAATSDAPDKINTALCTALGADDLKNDGGAALGDATAAKLVSADAKTKGITCKYNHTTKEVTVWATGNADIVSSNKGTPALNGGGGAAVGGAGN